MAGWLKDRLRNGRSHLKKFGVHMMERFKSTRSTYGLMRLLLMAACVIFYVVRSIDMYMRSYHPTQNIRIAHPMRNFQCSSHLNDSRNGTLQVFYNMYSPHDNLRRSHVRQIVREQMSVFQECQRNYKISITMIGADIKPLEICKEYNLSCTITNHYASGDEYLTLDTIRNYCVRNPSETVVYIHDKGSQHDRGGWNAYLRPFMMKAVTSPLCHNMPGTCNVCGSSFTPLPYSGFHGNMWVARCRYVRKLIPVRTLSQKLLEIRQKFIKNYTFTGPRIVGLPYEPREYDGVPHGRPAAEYWITSHPSFEPCDLYDSERKPTWFISFTPLVQNWPEQLKQAPRYPLQNWTDPRIRNLDAPHYSWQGNLRKKLVMWKYIYRKIPNKRSWIWKYFAR